MTEPVTPSGLGTVTAGTWVRGIVVSGLLGGLMGALTWGFLWLLGRATHFIWETLPEAIPFLGESRELTTILLCAFGGLLIGLLHQARQMVGSDDSRTVPVGVTESIALAEADDADHRDERGRLGIDAAFPAALGVVGLTFGASLGPEAALIMVLSALGRRLSRLVRLSAAGEVSMIAALAAFLGGPVAATALIVEERPGSISRRSTLLIGLTAAITAVIAFSALPGLGGAGALRFEEGAFGDGAERWLWGAAAAALAAILGLAVARLEHPWSQKLERAVSPVWLRSVLAGLALGLMGALQPLVLFSGHHESQELIHTAADFSTLVLVGIAMLKVVAILVVLSGKYLGGEIFPAIFVGVALGLALASLGAPIGVACAAGAAATSAAVLGKGVAAVLMVMLFFPLAAVPYLILGAIVGALASELATAKFGPVPSAGH